MAVPVVTSIAPDHGPVGGEVAVQISGSNFTGTTAVTVGGVAVEDFVVVSDTVITGHVDAAAAGLGDVVVTNGSGAGTGANLFTYGISTAAIEIANGAGVLLQNLGAVDVFISQDKNDPTKNGIKLTNTDLPLYLQVIHGKLYAATASGATDLRVLSL